jgi:hypothetical protein
MDFYQYTDNAETLIKSINKTKSFCYKFEKKFSETDLAKVWRNIRFCRYSSVLYFFIGVMAILYGIAFLRFEILLKTSREINTIIILALLLLVYKITAVLRTKLFEKKLKKEFGDFQKTEFKKSDIFDIKYYNILKREMVKILVFVMFVILACVCFSPIKLTKQYIENEEYQKAIKMASTGALVYPILPDWYSMRGYAKFQLSDYQGAINDYDKAYRLGADVYMNFDNKIYIKYYLKDYEGALKDFDKEISITSNEYESDAILWDKAQFLYNIARYKEALEIYTQLLAKADNDSIYLLKDRLYLERAQVYQQLKMYDLAQDDLSNSEAIETLDAPLDAIPKPMLILNEM